MFRTNSGYAFRVSQLSDFHLKVRGNMTELSKGNPIHPEGNTYMIERLELDRRVDRGLEGAAQRTICPNTQLFALRLRGGS